jgi:integrase
VQFNPVRGADFPPEEIRVQAQLQNHGQLNLLIENLPESASTAVWLVAVACVRPEELAFKWIDLDAEKRMLWVVRAVNRGNLHTPKYHRTNRPIRLTEADVERLLRFKRLRKAQVDDWMFPNRIRTGGKKMKPGPFWHEDLLGRVIEPAAKELVLPHVTWRLLWHWGATEMVEAKVPIKAAQERLGHSRPDILLKFSAHVLDASADEAASTLSQGLGAKSAALARTYQGVS